MDKVAVFGQVGMTMADEIVKVRRLTQGAEGDGSGICGAELARAG